MLKWGGNGKRNGNGNGNGNGTGNGHGFWEVTPDSAATSTSFTVQRGTRVRINRMSFSSRSLENATCDG